MTSRSFAWIVGLLQAGSLMAQVMFTGTPVIIDFDTTVAGVNNEQFAGTGFTAAPAVGQLDSDAWAITGPSDGPLVFGGTAISYDYTRGKRASGATYGTFYAFEVGGTANVGLGFQASGNDMTPGTITLRIQNNTGAVLDVLRMDYDIYCFNDQDHSTTLNFSYSTDNANYTSIPTLDYTSTLTADSSPTWQATSRVTALSSLAVPASSFLYLRWSTADASSGGARDELALDNLVLAVPEPSTGGWMIGALMLGWVSARHLRHRWARAV